MLTLLPALSLFALNVALNPPLFRSGEMPYRGSIEAGYVSMARFIAAHPNPWGWNPTQYCGLPTQFTYVPLVPYSATALIRLFPNQDPAHLYRILISTLACLGPVTLFLIVLYFTRSRWWALVAALGYTFLSPSYGLIEQIDTDRGFVPLPWRLHVLAKYGEGPHTAGLTLLPLALIAVWAAATKGRYRQIVLAAVALAAVPLTNWVAALALAFCGALLLLAGAGSNKISGFRATPVIAAGVLAYLLACFWLTPRFLKTVAFNWPSDAFNYHLQVQQSLLLVGLVAGIALLWLAFRKFPDQSYLCFLAMAFFGFGYVVLIYYHYGVDTVPESRRYALEFELFLFPLMSELLRQGTVAKSRHPQYALIAAGALLLWTTGASNPLRYIGKNNERWTPFPKDQTVEYQLAKWIADRHPAGRVFAFGGVCFRLNSWFDVPQVGGTFESGLKNRIPVHFNYQIRLGTGSTPDLAAYNAVLQLKAMGVEYLVVNGPRSQEYYHDFCDPQRFATILQPVYHEDDDWIYQLRFDSYAHLVRPEELPTEPPLLEKVSLLAPYVAAVDDPPRPKLRAAWRSPNELDIEGAIPEGMLVSVQASHDFGWTARQDGASIPIRRDQLGFMALETHPSPRAHIELRYRGTTDQRVAAAISGLAWVAAVAGLWVGRARNFFGLSEDYPIESG